MTDNITTAITDYFQNKKEIAAVYLFGSFAHGTAGPSSDLDLALLFENHEKDSISRQKDTYLVELSRLIRKDLHLVPMNTAGEVLLKQIFSKGRCILANNPKKLALFKMTAYAKIADFGYNRQKFQAGFARKVMQA
jgi:uncharacterized protein